MELWVSSLPAQDADPDIVKQILSYFARNRYATDSLEGVARWRLLEEQIYRSVQQTEAALQWLVARGFLLEIKSVGSVPVFRLDPNRHADAVKFLEQLDNDPEEKKS